MTSLLKLVNTDIEASLEYIGTKKGKERSKETNVFVGGILNICIRISLTGTFQKGHVSRPLFHFDQKPLAIYPKGILMSKR